MQAVAIVSGAYLTKTSVRKLSFIKFLQKSKLCDPQWLHIAMQPMLYERLPIKFYIIFRKEFSQALGLNYYFDKRT